MDDGDRRFWPFKARYSLIGVTVILVLVLLIVGLARAIFNWPSQQSENVLLIGVLVLSLLPIVLALLDVIIERGGVLEYGAMKIDFSRTQARAPTGFAVAPNIGVQGQPINDSSSAQILDTLRKATTSEVAVIDLEDGQAWWETRLLVLLAGAVRLKKPDKVVFLGTHANVEHRFEGWGFATDLLPCLVTAHPQYRTSLAAAKAAARQWELVEPVIPPLPPALPWASGGLAQAYQRMAFDGATGLPNELFAEQVLGSELGNKIEMQGGARSITLTRLDELFRTVLHKECIDLSWPPQQQLRAFLEYQTSFVAVTDHGQYSALASRASLSNEVLRSLVGQTDKN